MPEGVANQESPSSFGMAEPVPPVEHLVADV